MDKKHILDCKKSKIWEKEFKNVEDVIDNFILKDENISDFLKYINLIIRTSEVIVQATEKYFSKYDLSITQKDVLQVLYFSNKEYLTQIQISKFVYTSKSNISSILYRMEKKELIRREENKDNKREKKVFLTYKGKKLIEKLLKDVEKLPIYKIITEKESKDLIRLLSKLKNIYEVGLKDE